VAARTLLRDRKDLVVAPALVVLVGLLLVALQPGRAPNPDAVSYLTIAEHWARGEWARAFNTYWSPLLSWSHVPAAIAGWPLHEAARVLSVLIGLAAMVLLQRTMRQAGVSAPVRGLMSLAAVPFLVFASFHAVSPDLLVATLLLGFATESVDPSGSATRAGIYGGLAFLAKAYALPVVLVSPGVIMLCRALLRTHRAGVAHPLATGSIACAIALAWIVPVSLESGTFTISAASAYHRDIAAPGALGDPFRWAGLIEPAHDGAVSGWENPATMPRPADRPAFAASRQLPEHRILPADRHGGRLARLMANLSQLHKSFDLLLGSVLVAMLWSASTIIGNRPGGEAQPRAGRQCQGLELALFATVYTAGLAFLIVETRYLYFPMLVCIVLAAVWLSERRSRRPGTPSMVATCIVAVTTAIGPLTAVHSSFERADHTAAVQVFIGSAAGDLAGLRVASVPSNLGTVGSACYTLGCTYLGAPRLDVAVSVSEQLESFDVDLLVVIGEHGLSLPGFSVAATLQHDIGHERRRYALYRATQRMLADTAVRSDLPRR